MVKEIKRAGEVIETLSIITVFVSMIASGAKLVTLPQVKASVGELPVWQFVAAVQFVLILGFLFKLVHKHNVHSINQ